MTTEAVCDGVATAAADLLAGSAADSVTDSVADSVAISGGTTISSNALRPATTTAINPSMPTPPPQWRMRSTPNPMTANTAPAPASRLVNRHSDAGRPGGSTARPRRRAITNTVADNQNEATTATTINRGELLHRRIASVACSPAAPTLTIAMYNAITAISTRYGDPPAKTPSSGARCRRAWRAIASSPITSGATIASSVNRRVSELS